MVWEAQTCHGWLPKGWGCSRRRGPARDTNPNPASELTAALSYQVEQNCFASSLEPGPYQGIAHFLPDLSFSHLWPKEKALNQESLSYDTTSCLLSTGCVTSGY